MLQIMIRHNPSVTPLHAVPGQISTIVCMAIRGCPMNGGCCRQEGCHSRVQRNPTRHVAALVLPGIAGMHAYLQCTFTLSKQQDSPLRTAANQARVCCCRNASGMISFAANPGESHTRACIFVMMQ